MPLPFGLRWFRSPGTGITTGVNTTHAAVFSSPELWSASPFTIGLISLCSAQGEALLRTGGGSHRVQKVRRASCESTGMLGVRPLSTGLFLEPEPVPCPTFIFEARFRPESQISGVSHVMRNCVVMVALQRIFVTKQCTNNHFLRKV